MSVSEKKRKNKKRKSKKEGSLDQLGRDHAKQDVEEQDVGDQSHEDIRKDTWSKPARAEDDSDVQPKRKKKKNKLKNEGSFEQLGRDHAKQDVEEQEIRDQLHEDIQKDTWSKPARGEDDSDVQPKRKKKKNKLKNEGSFEQLGRDHAKQDVEEQEIRDQLHEDIQKDTWSKPAHAEDNSDLQPKRKKKKNKLKNEGSFKQLGMDHSEQDVEEQEIGDELHEDIQKDTWSKPAHAEDDSDTDEQPKRKKKKKQPVLTDTENKKGAKSIRQMKREKFASRQAQAQAASKDQLKTQCLNYLSQWKYDRKNWKFMKVKQVWLYKNKFSSHLVPDASWPQLLEYFDSAQGNIRKMLLDDANKIIKQLDEWTESQSKENDTDELEVSKPDDNVYKRARDLIQCLQE